MANTDKFDMIASLYDTPERIHIANVSADAIRAYIANSEHKTAVDFGCGTGLVGMRLINQFKSMLFIDSSSNMISEVQQKLEKLGINNADTLCFDAEKDDFVSLQADYIFMVQVLLHIPDVKLLLTRLFHALNAGGHLLIVDFDKNEAVASELVHNGFHQEQLCELMTAIGYHHIQSKTFYHGQSIFMGKDASMFILNAQK